MTPDTGEPATAVRPAPARPQPTTPVAPPWFAALFALAVAAHVVGNPPATMAQRLVVAALAAGALALLWHCRSRWLWTGTGVLVLLSAWLEAPVLGNHWLLMSVFAAAVVATHRRDDAWSATAATIRLAFLVFYAFAAFAKLNTAFIDPAASCAVFYADQGLGSWGLPPVPAGLAMAPIVAALVVEVSIPPLLIVRRTRGVGVALAAVFHVVISFDLAQHFYDFTSVILLAVMLFAGGDVTDPVARWVTERRRSVAVVAAAWGALMLAIILPLPATAVAAARLLVFVLWIPLGGALAWLSLRGVRHPAAVAMRPAGAVAVALVALVAVNGALPYTGLKTATGWNMYANLVTVDGRANHLVVPGRAEVAGVRYVRVTRTSDEALAPYVEGRWAVPERNLRDHLARHPETVVTFARPDGTVVSGTGARLGEPLPEVVRRLLPLRSVDTGAPARCQPVWLPVL